MISTNTLYEYEKEEIKKTILIYWNERLPQNHLFVNTKLQ